MTWPFENDTSQITKKLAKESMRSEKRRNVMVIIAVALAAFCFALRELRPLLWHKYSVVRLQIPMRRSGRGLMKRILKS